MALIRLRLYHQGHEGLRAHLQVLVVRLALNETQACQKWQVR